MKACSNEVAELAEYITALVADNALAEYNACSKKAALCKLQAAA